MSTDNNEMEVRANLFGGYEQGTDPWADPWSHGGYQPDQTTSEPNVTDTPVPEVVPVPPDADIKAVQPIWPDIRRFLKNNVQDNLKARRIESIAREAQAAIEFDRRQARDAAQRTLDKYSADQQAQRAREEAQYGILDGVVWSIREALRNEGIEVFPLEDISEFQHKPIHTDCQFELTEIRKHEFKVKLAKSFVDEFLRNNPTKAVMFFAKAPLPQGVQVARHFAHDGLILRGVGDYYIAADSTMVRVDCLYTVATEENLLSCPTPTAETEPSSHKLPTGSVPTHPDLTTRQP